MDNLPAYLILMLTDQCNLSCRYCYLGQNRKPTGKGRDMEFSTIDQALELIVQDQRPFHVQLTGGEPFLVPQLVAHAAGKIRQLIPSATMGIQTNGTCLDSVAIDLIQKFNLEPGISLDGDPPVQEALRGRAAQTFKGMALLEKSGIPFNVTTVVSALNAETLHRLVLVLGGFSMARGIGLDLLVVKGDASRDSLLPAEPAQIRSGIRQMRKALAMVNQGRTIPLVVRELEKIKKNQSQSRSRPFCHGARGQSLAVTPEGNFFPCSQTAYDPRFFLGSLDRDGSWTRAGLLKPCDLNLILSGVVQGQFQTKSQDRQDISNGCDNFKNRCMTCSLDGVCPGECPSRLYYNRDRRPDAVCSLYQALAEPENFHLKSGV